MNYKNLLDFTIKNMNEAGADKAQCVITSTEKHELNTENKVVKLFRTTKENNILMSYIKDNKKSTQNINKIDEESIKNTISELVSLAEVSPADEAYDIAPKVDPQTFNIGTNEPDLDTLYDLLDQFNQDLNEKHSTITGDATISYDHVKKYVGNSNGLYLEELTGNYNFTMLFSAKDGEKITSFNYTFASFTDLKQKLTDVGMLEELLIQTAKELEAKPFDSKFVGDVIITPICLSNFLSTVAGVSLSDGALLSDTSLLKDKVDELVFSPKLTWHSSPRNPELSGGYAITSDGHVAEDITILENGVLKNLLISQYGAKKLNRERSKNYGSAFVVEPGDASFDEMVKSIDKGILLCRFSGGQPSANGDFAGVAKNSFYIEDGKIQYPISETMISGNLFEVLKDIKSITKDRVNFGNSIVPWVHSTGVTVSGK